VSKAYQFFARGGIFFQFILLIEEIRLMLLSVNLVKRPVQVLVDLQIRVRSAEPTRADSFATFPRCTLSIPQRSFSFAVHPLTERKVKNTLNE
jgi:hypothetical protein